MPSVSIVLLQILHLIYWLCKMHVFYAIVFIYRILFSVSWESWARRLVFKAPKIYNKCKWEQLLTTQDVTWFRQPCLCYNSDFINHFKIIILARKYWFESTVPKWKNGHYTAHRAVVRSLSSYSWCIVLHGIAWQCIVLHSIAWYCMVLHGIAWYCMVLHCIA